MANPYFKFKQFTVYQQPGMLKVSTDSCIFGAWVVERMASAAVPSALMPTGRALDIGAGTGLLMLMLAQQWEGCMDGIEIDALAYEQALENLAASPWASRLRLFHGDIKTHALAGPYDLIISNPPFFEGDLHSPARHKNLAKHSAGLTLDALLDAVRPLAAAGGSLALLLPYHRLDAFTGNAAAAGWLVRQQLLVRQTPAHGFFRACVWLEKGYTGEMQTETMAIHTPERAYSERMAELLKPYYLYL